MAHVRVGEREVEGGLHYSGRGEGSVLVGVLAGNGDELEKEERGSYPIGPALRTSRSRSSPSIRTFTPAFSWPIRFSCGTKTSSKMSSPVLEPLMPSLSSLRATEKPGVAVSTRNVEMPFDLRDGSVLA